MKKILLMFIIMSWMAIPLFAAGITDATKPLGHMKFSMAAENNYVLKRDVEKPPDREEFRIEKTSQIYAKASMGYTPHINLYTKLGLVKTNIKNRGLDGINRDIETNNGFFWGIGLSGSKSIYSDWRIGVDAQASLYKLGVDTFNSSSSNISGEITSIELQGTPFISRKFEIKEVGSDCVLNPYIGLSFSYLKNVTNEPILFTNSSGVSWNTSWTVENDNIIGLVLGSSLELNNYIALQLEGRLLDETAVTFGGNVKF